MRNLLLAGTSLVSGEGQALVFATGMHTEFGQIAHLTQTSGGTPSHLQAEIARLSRLVAIFATGLGLLFFGVGQWLGLPFWTSLMFAIGIIVANVPEGLLPTVTLSLAITPTPPWPSPGRSAWSGGVIRRSSSAAPCGA